METTDFTTTILVEQTPEEVFNAIINVGDWWTGNPGIEGSANKLNDEFTYRYAPSPVRNFLIRGAAVPAMAPSTLIR
ncbi:MAG: hypothetical protein NVS3B8_13280 [Chitinophagaceae bacterium]